MRTLLSKLTDWWYFRSPARIPTLMEQSIPVWKMQDIESRLASLEFVVDRFVGPRLAAKKVVKMLAHLSDEEAAALLRETVERMKAEDEK